MEYRRLGKSGLKVSEFSFGAWVTFGKQYGEDGAASIMPKEGPFGEWPGYFTEENVGETPVMRDVLDFEVCILSLAIVIGNTDEPRLAFVQIAANRSKDLRVVEKLLRRRCLATLALTD